MVHTKCMLLINNIYILSGNKELFSDSLFPLKIVSETNKKLGEC